MRGPARGRGPAARALAQRLVELYQADAPDIVTVVLESHGFADLLERGDFMQRVSEQDQRIIGLVRAARADATATEARRPGTRSASTAQIGTKPVKSARSAKW